MVFGEIVNTIQDLIFPAGSLCPLCGRPGDPGQLCPACLRAWAELGRGMEICPHCGRFGNFSSGAGLCPECEGERPPFVLARGVAPYAGPVRDALHLFKFAGKRELAAPLGALMAALAADHFPCRLFAGAVPVPLHPSREKERRFNQAALLAAAVARELRLPLVDRALLRGRETPSQTSLSRAGRRVNLAGAFLPGEDAPRLRGKTVLLVDDVYTTGATAAECCHTLMEAGVSSVYVVTLATAAIKEQGRREES